MSPRVTFYDVPADARWPEVARLAEAAWRKATPMLVLCADPEEARAFDAFLWTYRDEAFLPHELVPDGGRPADEEARLVIVTSEHRPIPAAVLVQLSPASMEFASGFSAVIDLVDHRDPARLAASRARYRAWKQVGADPGYRKVGRR